MLSKFKSSLQSSSSHFCLSLLVPTMLATGCATTNTSEQLLDAQGIKFAPLSTLISDSRVEIPDTLPTLPNYAANIDPNADYIIGPSDEIIVSVWGFPALGSQIPVGGDSRRNISIVKQNGQIQLPFLGNFQAGGLTTQQASEQLTQLYTPITERDDTQVDVTIASYLSRSARVNGEVSNPGNVFLSDQILTIKDAIDSTGGPTRSAASSQATVKRDGKLFRLNYYAGLNEENSGILNYPLAKGDVIYFPHINEQSIHVLGEVGNQGFIPIPQEGVSILEALSRQGGLNLEFADVENILLIRQDKISGTEKPKIYKLTYAELLLNESIPLQDGDRIFVPPTDMARWQRGWQQILPFIVGASQGSAIYRNFNNQSR